ncbi:tetratricopeptide repeat protein [Maridesulfovibrio zosterae]|uniref:tetratricopeptide repeat protein n=1 Tax=Maridesulfovibrio zosterae TaxID=82171 RepID=UPI000413C0E0|nr:tetratricopeptide repeat protein [Maridesulfovibrio zosterae]
MAAVIWLACPHPGYALEYFIDTKADMDTIRFVFDQKNISGKVRRTGRNQITISFPDNALAAEKKPTPAPVASLRIVDSLKVGKNSITLGTRITGFGFIRIPAGNGEMLIQVFRDPIGSKWRSPNYKAKKEAERKKAAQKRAAQKRAAQKKAASKKVADQKKSVLKTSAKSTTPVEKKESRVESKPVEKKQVIRKSVEKPPVISEVDLPDSEESPVLKDELKAAQEINNPAQQDVSVPSRRPFYSVPYTYRAPVSNVGPGEAKPVDTSIPPARAGIGYNKTAQASYPDTGNSAGSVVPVSNQEVHSADNGKAGGQVVPETVQSEGGVAGGVMPPPQTESDSFEAVRPSGEGGVSGAVSPPQLSEGGASGRIAPPPSQASGTVNGPVAGSSIVPPDSGASGQVVPPPQNEDSFEAGEYDTSDQGDENVNASALVGEADATEGAEGDSYVDDGSDAFPVESSVGEDEEGGTKKEMTLEEKIKIAKGMLLAAESTLADGQVQAAVDGFKEISLLPYIPTDMRLRALYGKAEALTELYKDAPADNFGETSSAWMEAMNADTKAPNVPMALLNLGLLNLKVGNMPEAKAYFNLLKSQYPNDPNIPYISYYWGQYYLGLGEYEKAADQFQYLVQMYPDSKVVRDAALGLAKALDKLGYDEQAYQIIDYIDKRWPRFYIEDLDFLLMAANTQNRLGKVNDAKGNYWAYYNLAPDAKEADIVLARIGDIYLKQGDKDAAKEIYEKAAKDFPDKEGGLVAMMRLAEEGIYDDPSMSQMDKVFDRPYNLRPQKIYNRIVEKHPDSPLAPLAQLKLGMWYYWNKKYGDCLSAVQDFLDKYPRSALREKASQLGTQVFDKAVPELVKDENYGRVIDYWNKYAAKNDDGKGVNDDTRMGVALSYWKKAQPQKALELIDRYLQEEEVPKYSAMALDMALGIYVEDQAWSKVTNLVNLAKNKWKLDPKQQVQIEYAQAMAYENLGETERSTPLWAGLASNLLLPESSRAYSMYYMAKSSMKKKELKKVFIYAQEALSMLLETGGDREKIKDCILMTIFAAESSGRYREALKWAAEYDKYIPISDSEWASSRFRLAQLYEKAGAMSEWKKLMEEVAEKSADDLYGRLAKSALETHKIEQDASKFKPNMGFQ